MLDRILIVGLGSAGKRHARLIRQQHPDARISAFSSRPHKSLDDLGLDQVFDDLGGCIGFDPQCAVIANPASMHVDIALQFAKRGTHLLIEKPLSDTPLGVKKLISTCRRKGSALMIGYNLRFSPSLQHFGSMILQGKIGRIWSVRATVGQYLPDWRPDIDYRNSVSANSALGGGVLLELSHELDYLRWIFGDVDWLQAATLQQSNLAIDVEDTAHLLLGFAENGLNHPVAALNMDFIRRDTERTCTAIGEFGSLRWNGLTATVDAFEDSSKGWQILYAQDPSTENTYGAQWKYFVDCVSRGVSPAPDGDDGMAVLQLIDGVRRSAKTGRRIRLKKRG